MNTEQVRAIDEAVNQVCIEIGQNPLPGVSLSPHVELKVTQALSAWSECENGYLQVIGRTREDVLNAFHAFHNKMLVATMDEDLLRMESPNYLCMIESSLHVRNVSWVSVFTCILPSVDRANAARYIYAGQMMVVAFFYRYVCGCDRDGECYQFPMNIGAHPHLGNIERYYVQAFWGDLAQAIRLEG